VVDWAKKQPKEKFPSVKRIDATTVEAKTRIGQPLFQLILNEKIIPPGRSTYIDPLIVYDLDGDGLSEIILAAGNLVYHRRGQETYSPQPLCRYPIDYLTTAVIADFDGDGAADFLCANFSGLFLFKGSPKGTFEEPPRQAWRASPPLKNAMVLTCGDMDEDGNLDVFVGQYKVPTLGQTLRPNYYNANDGWPSHLLLNDGHGNFTDATEPSGLGPKRWRRTYSASLADLNGDGHLDLVVVSDFAGLDLYQNDGHAQFTEVTRQWVPEPHAFGMAHALADFNGDGRLDLLMIGMPSPTVDRLSHLGLWRPYSDEDLLVRPAMAFGNRLYLSRPDAKFEQTALNQSIARSGWSWGCSAFDFDNDGLLDVYIANGLESRQSVQDYEPEFWLHDIFVDESIDDPTATGYFMDKFSRTRGSGWSYGGYEKNRLYLNRSGQSFLEIGHLAGVALEQDSRNVVTDDLDGDGRTDLLLTTLEVWPETKQTLQVYKNTLTDSGHWIGFRFHEGGRGKSPAGVRVTIQHQGHQTTRQIVAGDSHRSQHATTLHFGLGASDRVDSAEIRWQNGQVLSLSQLTVDRYYDIKAPDHQ
jgi:enediyne biosynthesis protein E4